MHRSGTSCLAGMLQLAGFNAGLVDEWNPDNLKGNRENQSVLKLNERILYTSGGAWDDPPPEIITQPEDSHFRDQILNGLAEQGGPWLFKDPRVVITLPFWLQADSKFKMIGIIRHPLAVAQSLLKRNNTPIPEGLRLWKVYNSSLLDAIQKYEIPLLYFIDKKEDFLIAVRSALTSLFPLELESGTIDLDCMGDFFTEDLVHNRLKPSNNMLDRLIESGLEAVEAQDLNLLWEDLLKHVANPPEYNLEHFQAKSTQREHKISPVQTKSQDFSVSDDFESSLNQLNKLISSSSNQIEMWRQGISLFEHFEMEDKLSDWIETWLEKRPNEPFLLFELAKSYWREKHVDKAIQSAEKSYELAHGWLPPLKHLADWYTKSGQWEKATKALTQLSEYSGAELETRKSLYAQVYFDLGDGYKEVQSLRSEVLITNVTIDLTFDLPQTNDIIRLRVDPINDASVIKMLSIQIINAMSGNKPVQHSFSNAQYEENSCYYFAHNDPQFHFEDILLRKEIPHQLKVKFEILHSGTDALHACIEALSKPKNVSTQKTDKIAAAKNGSDIKKTPRKPSLPPCLSQWNLNDINHQPGTSEETTVSGHFDVFKGYSPKLAIKYASSTRIYPLDKSIPKTLEQVPDDSEGLNTTTRFEFCRIVPRNSIIKLGIEHDMRLFWLTSIET